MILISLKTKPEIESKVVSYLKMNEIDSLNIGGGNFFVLSKRYPNDVLENCKNYLKLSGIRYAKNMLVVSPMLNVAFLKSDFDKLKKYYEIK